MLHPPIDSAIIRAQPAPRPVAQPRATSVAHTALVSGPWAWRVEYSLAPHGFHAALQPEQSDVPAARAVQPVTSVSFEGKEFIDPFNAAADRTRLVLVFAPS